MAPYEITHPGGSIEHWNEEAGAVWMQRVTEKFDKVIWPNPLPENYWGDGGSLGITRQLMGDPCFRSPLKDLSGNEISQQIGRICLFAFPKCKQL